MGVLLDEIDGRRLSELELSNYSLSNSVSTFFDKAEILRGYSIFAREWKVV